VAGSRPEGAVTGERTGYAQMVAVGAKPDQSTVLVACQDGSRRATSCSPYFTTTAADAVDSSRNALKTSPRQNAHRVVPRNPGLLRVALRPEECETRMNRFHPLPQGRRNYRPKHTTVVFEAKAAAASLSRHHALLVRDEIQCPWPADPPFAGEFWTNSN
jgi:hypothetical protein